MINSGPNRNEVAEKFTLSREARCARRAGQLNSGQYSYANSATNYINCVYAAWPRRIDINSYSNGRSESGGERKHLHNIRDTLAYLQLAAGMGNCVSGKLRRAQRKKDKGPVNSGKW